MTANSHLSDYELAELAAGNASQTVLAHLQACTECGFEAREVREAIAGFRGALTLLAGEPLTAGERSSRASRSMHAWGVRIVGALAILAMVCGGVLLDRNTARKLIHPAPVSDSELLNQVQDELSDDSPAALAPAGYLADERDAILETTPQAQPQQGRH